jgi:hypothetical protein
MARLAQLAPRVDALLHADQKEVVRTFSCCLVPPKSLSDPVRAGQASAGDREVQTLRYVRGIPADRWPEARKSLLDKVEFGVAARDTGTTAQELAAERKRVGAVFEKARSCSDTDFEMQKDDLAADLHRIPPSARLEGRKRQYMTAQFLLVPGSAEVYDALIRRLDASAQKPTPRSDRP